MLNLDTEDWGEFYLGCAGGLDVNVQPRGQAGSAAGRLQAWRIDLRRAARRAFGRRYPRGAGQRHQAAGARAAHLERTHALRLAACRGHRAQCPAPRSPRHVALPAGQRSALAAASPWQALLREELRGVDEGVTLEPRRATASRTDVSADDQALWLASLHAAPHGVRRRSLSVPGVVETSNNLGMVELTPRGGSCNFMVRSLLDSGSTALADEIVAACSPCPAPRRESRPLPGLGAQPGVAAAGALPAVYRREFGSLDGAGDPRRPRVRHHRRQLPGHGHRLLRPHHPRRPRPGRAGRDRLGG
jgi:dipeptidase D